MTPTTVRRLGVAAVAAVVAALPAAAQPVPANSPLRYVPADAAAFVHADVAALWDSPLGAAVRAAEAKGLAELAAKAKELAGVTPDQVKTVTAFWPSLATPADAARPGVVLTFKAPPDAAAFKAGLRKALPPDFPVLFKAPDATTAVVLLGGLPNEYAAPRPAGEAGPLSGYVREAAAGYVLAAGVTRAKLPPELTDEDRDVPPAFVPFLPLARADAAAAFVSAGKDWSLDVRVKADTPQRATQAKKALAAAVALARGELDRLPKAAPGLKNTAAVLAAVNDGLKAARLTTAGTEARGRVTIPADLPLAGAAAEMSVKVRETAARGQSFNNLKQLSLGLLNYESTLTTFPPAAVVDKAGRPLLSWRVLVLPYLEQEPLYRQFKLDEAWDGPTNKKLIDKMPSVFALPAALASKAKAGETHYQAFVGKGAAIDLIRPTRIADFTDGLSNTLLLATAANPVPWTKPDDIRFDPAADMTKALGFFDDVCHAAFADGAVRAVARSVDAKVLAALITRAGGEIIPNE